jgi:hypothetical protein
VSALILATARWATNWATPFHRGSRCVESYVVKDGECGMSDKQFVLVV